MAQETKQINGKPTVEQQAVIASLVEAQGAVKDNSTAHADQQAIVNAVEQDSTCVAITTKSVLGATLVSFNAIAKKHNRKEMSPQEWAELAIATGLLAMKRAWEYSDKTRNNTAYVEEMRAIAKLFTVPESTHPKYMEKMVARFEAEQACRAKYGVQ